ncbi:Gustatory receptor 106 [Halyomorpha halys]|nr:Gustatory receptor 106 [Halyomorpha halys]
MDTNIKYSVERALEQILFIPRLVGSFPLDRNYKLSWRLWVFIIDVIVYFVLAFYEIFIKKFQPQSNYIFMLMFAVQLPSLTNFVSMYSKLNRIKDFFKELLAFEQYTREIGVVWNCHYRWKKYLSLLFLGNSIIASLLDLNDLNEMIDTIVRRIHLYIACLIIANQISGTTSLLASSIAHLKYIRDDRQLLRRFEHLIFLRRNIEDYFGLQILAICTSSFVTSVLLAFWFTTNFLNMFHKVSLFLLSLYPLVTVCIPLLSVVSQAKKIDKLLYRRLLANPDDELLEFHMIAKRDVSFTAFGFFHINSSLISSMIGAGTTYLVILLQYGE